MPSYRWVYLICGLLAAAGLWAFDHGLAIPVYSDQELARSLKLAVCGSEGRPLQEIGDQLRSLRSSRHDFMQGGLSLILAAITIAMLSVLFRSGTKEGIATPSEPSALVALGIAATILLWLAEFWSFELNYARGDLLICSGAPLFGAYLGMILFAGISIALVSVVGKSLVKRMPARCVSLFEWDSMRRSRSIWITIAFGILLLISAALLIATVTSSAFLCTPAMIIFAYIFLASRAGLLAEKGDSGELG